jgi:hypothetical protein
MSYPPFTAGFPLTAADLTAMQWQTVEQGSDQTATSNTTFADTNLAFTGVAGATYLFDLAVNYTGNGGDIQLDWTVPTNGAAIRFIAGIGPAATGASTFNNTTTTWRRIAANIPSPAGDGVGASTNVAYFETGEFDAGDGGAITLRFAQNTSNAATTTFSANSRLRYLRIA